MAGLDGDATSTTVYLDDLNPLNPAYDDDKHQGDDHIRFIKRTLVNTFPNITGIVTSTQDELNLLHGATVTTSEINYLDGVTSNVQTQIDTKFLNITETKNSDGYYTYNFGVSDNANYPGVCLTGNVETTNGQIGLYARPSLTGPYVSVSDTSLTTSGYPELICGNLTFFRPPAYIQPHPTESSFDAVITRARVGSSSTSNAFQVQNSAGTAVYNVRADGFISLSGTYDVTTSYAANVYVGSSGGLYRSTSSRRYKDNIQNYTQGLAAIDRLRPVTFTEKGKSDVLAGFIAEEVDEAGLKEFVQYDAEGRPDAIHYGMITALLVKSIQELKVEVEELKAKLNGN